MLYNIIFPFIIIFLLNLFMKFHLLSLSEVDDRKEAHFTSSRKNAFFPYFASDNEVLSKIVHDDCNDGCK